jgi:hypothetical protein
MDYRIVIPSYQRPETCQSQSINTLLRLGADPSQIDVWVADNEQRDLYTATLSKEINILVAEKGLDNARRIYHQHYTEGTPLLNVDDDLLDLVEKDGDKLVPLSVTLEAVTTTGFEIANAVGARLWGVNAVANGFFMGDTISVGLRYICGNFFGSYAGDPVYTGAREVPGSSGEDFLNTLRSYTRYGNVVRLDYLATKTKFFAAGGIDAELKTEGIAERQDDHAAALNKIANAYPNLAKTYTKSGGITNLRLKTITEHKIGRPEWHR